MCQTKDEEGERSSSCRAAKALSNEDLTPPEVEGTPVIAWAATTNVASLRQKYEPEIAYAAVQALLQVRNAEPQATSDVQNVAALLGGRAAGLEYRMKSPESLARKLALKQEAILLQGGSSPDADSIAKRMNDILRYTVEVPDHDTLTKAGAEAVRLLQGRGWEIVEVEHSYVSGNPYKGFHIVGRPPKGPLTEVQVHSELSLATKMETHGDYEVYRDPATPKAKRLEAGRSMKAKSALIPTPSELDNLTEIDGIPVRKKTYR